MTVTDCDSGGIRMNESEFMVLEIVVVGGGDRGQQRTMNDGLG